MQETEKIKADNQISKNENLVQVCFFNQSHFKMNRKAVNLSRSRGSSPSPGGPCHPTHCRRWVAWCCCHPAAWPGQGTGHRAGHSQLVVPLLLPHCPTTALGRAPAAQEPRDLQHSRSQSHMRCSGRSWDRACALGKQSWALCPCSSFSVMQENVLQGTYLFRYF